MKKTKNKFKVIIAGLVVSLLIPTSAFAHGGKSNGGDSINVEDNTINQVDESVNVEDNNVNVEDNNVAIAGDSLGLINVPITVGSILSGNNINLALLNGVNILGIGLTEVDQEIND